MGLSISEIKNKPVWENFLLAVQEKTFLHSWNWGEFQEKMGNKAVRMGIYEGAELRGEALLLEVKSRRGKFIFIPHGPILRDNSLPEKERSVLLLTRELKKLASKGKFRFLRVAPIWPRDLAHQKIFSDLGYRQAVLHTHPEVTWELDIGKSEEEILRNMRKTTRYLIRKAQGNPDISVIKTDRGERILDFEKLYRQTASRHRFVPFSDSYLESQFSCFAGDNQILLFLAEYKKEVISGAVVVFWQDIAFYHHGASVTKYPDVPAAYLLQWEAIREAKKRGCKIYNFWGIAPEIREASDAKKSSHPWAGLSLFKMGFGGGIKEYLKTQDLPVSKSYILTRLVERVRKAKRRL